MPYIDHGDIFSNGQDHVIILLNLSLTWQSDGGSKQAFICFQLSNHVYFLPVVLF